MLPALPSVNFSSIFSSGMPCSPSSILFKSQTARVSMFRNLTSFMAGRFFLRPELLRNLANWRITSLPTIPVPMTATATVSSESVKPSCAARKARARSVRSTTAEILRSEEPCAIATMFTFALPRALKKRPEIPAQFFIPSPMTAIMLSPFLMIALVSLFRAISSSKALWTACKASSPSFSATATEIECSEEPCEVSITLTPAFDRASIKRFATPCVPKKDAPEIVTRLIFSMDVMALTGISASMGSSTWSSHLKKSSPRP
mmetsp:Transcript_10723/g.19064  ORF Transcript_10723/g.19064 Transcript_10723/m.19064 type:complete len:261 (+) Transcript_10723:1272-2054(+)